MASAIIIGLYVAAAVVMLLMMKVLVTFTLAANKQTLTQDADDVSAKLLPSDLLRPLLLYSQYILVIGSMNINFPVTLTYPIRVLSWFWAPASPETLSIDCLFEPHEAMPKAVQRLLFYLLTPIAMLVILLIIEAATLKLYHRESVRAGLADRLYSYVLVVLFMFLPSVSRNVFSFFACMQIDNPPAGPPYTAAAVGHFWTLDLNAQCWVSYHRAWAYGLGLPCLLLMCVCLPAGILYKTLKNRHRMDDPHFIHHYGFLYRPYKVQYCWWEAVIVLETLVLVAISVFGTSLGPYFQGLIMNAALAIMAFLLLAFKPQAHHAAYRVSLYSMCCLLVTNYTALSFLPYENLQAGALYGVIMGALVLFVNVGFILFVVWKLYKLVELHWEDIMAALQKYSRILSRKASSLASFGSGSLKTPQLPTQDTSNVSKHHAPPERLELPVRRGVPPRESKDVAAT